MIEFRGEITGEAKERLFEKARNLDQSLGFASVAAVYPVIIFYSIINEYWLPIWLYPIGFVAIFLAARIPKSQKEKAAMIPIRIYTDNEYIIAVTEKGEEKRRICDVKEVQDCKTFYELTFRFGKLSTKFICQKDLLTEGSLEDFEALFEGKITDLTSYFE